jgi:hypothetical protein
MCRRFTLVRDQHDGVNQPGIVAEGVLFSMGKVTLFWTQPPRSITMFDSLADVLLVQNQNGVTRLVWTDGQDEPKQVRTSGRYALEVAKGALAAMLGDDHVLVSSASPRSTRLEFARSMRS